MLRHLYFYDRNERHDRMRGDDLRKLKECEVFAEMEGKMETLSNDWYCAHLVTFGDYVRRDGEVPFASLPGANLKLVDEQ